MQRRDNCHQRIWASPCFKGKTAVSVQKDMDLHSLLLCGSRAHSVASGPSWRSSSGDSAGGLWAAGGPELPTRGTRLWRRIATRVGGSQCPRQKQMPARIWEGVSKKAQLHFRMCHYPLTVSRLIVLLMLLLPQHNGSYC